MVDMSMSMVPVSLLICGGPLATFGGSLERV